jgi:prepilin-type N-terminal cleavage/methylation domain-containing protein
MRDAHRGFTLVELLVAMAVTGPLLGGLWLLLHTGLQAYTGGAMRVEAQQSARWALERMAGERLVRDLNENGVVEPTQERVTYLWDATARVLRRDAGGGAQPLIDHVETLELTYFDGAGRITSEPAHVRGVRVRLVVGREGLSTIVETAVTLRN